MAATTRSRTSIYDVFLSFRGSDTRLNFTGNLYKALCDRGIYTFIDDEQLQRGEEITPTLLKTIQESRIAITVLSKDYASSSFCLDELAAILHCAQNNGLLVIPVFYNVDPSDVRKQKGSYGVALANHENRFEAKKDKLKKWKGALYQVADLCGYHFKDGDVYEYKFIGSIVDQVSREINRVSLNVVDYPVGLDSQVLEVRKLLDVGSDDVVHIIGIHGMGGLGKTTLALAIYNLISVHFDESCFFQNVREESNKHGLKHLQSTILSKLLREKDITLTSRQEGASMIQHRLQRKKVLLILDDVDKHEQLQAIVGKADWFGPGSRVLITTRDKQLLKFHEVERTYEVKVLNKNDALQLLTRNAFKREKVDPSFEEVLNRVVTYASGLPLALEVIGSNLLGKSIQEWKDAINKYERSVPKGIQGVLKISFEALEEEEKNIFLDIACCFNGYELAEVEDILCAHYGSNMKGHINVLIEKSLMKLSYFDCGKVTLHDLIKHMGKDIVRHESLMEPGERSRLCSWEDIKQVLEDNTGTSKIKTIHLEFSIFSKEMVEWDEEAFKKMTNLRTLIMKNCNFSTGPKYFPNGLRVLEWWGYPSHCLPSDFNPKKLFICKLSHSHIKSLKFNGLSKMFGNLKVLSFDGCEFLSQTPDVSGFPNLEKFSFEYCRNLVTVHESIGSHNKLKKLNASGCSKLGSFPPIQMTCLEELNLSYCGSLESFPEILGKMENIKNLLLNHVGIKELPFSFKNLIGLQDLSLDCHEIVQLPSSIVMMPKLTCLWLSIPSWKEWKWQQEESEEKVSPIKSLDVAGSNLNDDFFSIGFTRFAHVENLDLSGNNFTHLPQCIEEFQSLETLRVNECKLLREISRVPPKLKIFSAMNCESLNYSSRSMFINQELHAARILNCCLPGACVPEWFVRRSSGPSSLFWFRNHFPAKILCLLVAPVICHDLFYFPIPMVYINGEVQNRRFRNCRIWERMTEMDHTCLFHLLSRNSLYEVPFANEWSRVEVTYEGLIDTSFVKQSGIHIFSSLEDIRFHES